MIDIQEIKIFNNKYTIQSQSITKEIRNNLVFSNNAKVSFYDYSFESVLVGEDNNLIVYHKCCMNNGSDITAEEVIESITKMLDLKPSLFNQCNGNIYMISDYRNNGEGIYCDVYKGRYKPNEYGEVENKSLKHFLNSIEDEYLIYNIKPDDSLEIEENE